MLRHFRILIALGLSLFATVAHSEVQDVKKIVIRSSEGTWLQVSEVIARDAAGKDQALVGSATAQGSSYGGGSRGNAPAKAIDGVGPAPYPEIFHSASTRDEALTITFAEPFALHSLEIYGRIGNSGRDVYDIDIYDSAGRVFASVTRQSANNALHLAAVLLDGPVTAPQVATDVTTAAPTSPPTAAAAEPTRTSVPQATAPTRWTPPPAAEQTSPSSPKASATASSSRPATPAPILLRDKFTDVPIPTDGKGPRVIWIEHATQDGTCGDRQGNRTHWFIRQCEGEETCRIALQKTPFSINRKCPSDFTAVYQCGDGIRRGVHLRDLGEEITYANLDCRPGAEFQPPPRMPPMAPRPFVRDDHNACAVPQRRLDNPRVYSGVITPDSADWCLDLGRFAGWPVHIEVTRGARDSSLFLDEYFLEPSNEEGVYRITVPAFDAPRGLRLGSLLLSLTGASGPVEVTIRAQTPEEAGDAYVHAAAWALVGGFGYSAPRALLIDDADQVLLDARCSRFGSMSSPIYVANGFDPRLYLPGQRVSMIYPGPVPTSRVRGVTEVPPGFSEENLQAMDTSNVIKTGRVLEFLNAQHIVLQRTDGQKVTYANTGANRAFHMLARQCAQSAAQSFAVDTVYSPRGLTPSPSLRLGHRQVLKAHAAITGLSAPAAQVDDFYRLLAMYNAVERLTCVGDRYTGDDSCRETAVSRELAALKENVPAVLLEEIWQEPKPTPYEVVPPDAALIDELVTHGYPKDMLRTRAQVLRDTDAYKLVWMGPENGGARVLFLHNAGAPEEALTHVIDPSDPQYMVALKASAAQILTEIWQQMPNREAVDRLYVPVSVTHQIRGVPFATSQLAFDATRTVGLQPAVALGRFGMNGSFENGRLVEIATLGGLTSKKGIAEPWVLERAANEASKQRAIEARARREEKRLAAERAMAEAALAGRYIYRNRAFWGDADGFSPQIATPPSLRQVFQGRRAATLDEILTWAQVYSAQCGHLLPDTAVLFETITTVERRNLLGQYRGGYQSVERLRVDPRLAPAVRAARAARSSPNYIMQGALGRDGLMNALQGQNLQRLIRRVLGPLQLVAAMVQDGGCDGPMAMQMQTNIHAGLGFGKTVRESPILSAAEAERLSDPPL